jgi:hypothetical protein
MEKKIEEVAKMALKKRQKIIDYIKKQSSWMLKGSLYLII